MTGRPGAFNIYSFPAWLRHRALLLPLHLRVHSSALDLVSSEMEDAANILGAGTAHHAQVTLPLVLPAILGGLIISSSRRSRCSARRR